MSTVRPPTTRRAAAARSKTIDENSTGVAQAPAGHSRKPSSSTSAAIKAKASGALNSTSGVKAVAGVKRNALGDVSNKAKEITVHVDGASKNPKEANVRTTRSRSSSSATNTTTARARAALSKTNSSGAVLDANASNANARRSASAAPSAAVARPSVAVAKPIIKIDDAPMEEDEEEEEEEETTSSSENTAEVEQAQAKSGENARSVIEKGAAEDAYHFGQAAHEEQEVLEEELEEEDGLAQLTAEQREESEALLQEIKETFEEQYEDTDFDEVMVSEYRDEIFAYMAELEIKSMANPHYMSTQMEIEWSMRATLIDWLQQVHVRYKMTPETLWISINIIDRFLSLRVVSLIKLQLVGVTAMFIAAKYEEIMAPPVEDYVYMTENGYTVDEILKGERIVLQTLDFDISSYCSPYTWMRRISKADGYDEQIRNLAKLLTEITLLDHRFLQVKPSQVAAIGMFLAGRMFGTDWTDAHVIYSNYTEAELMPGAELIVELLLDPKFQQHYVLQKYDNKKYVPRGTKCSTPTRICKAWTAEYKARRGY